MPRGRKEGNPGNKGGGRKTKAEEIAGMIKAEATLQQLNSIWMECGLVQFRTAIASGDMKAINKLVDKLYANKNEIKSEHSGEIRQDVTVTLDIMNAEIPKKKKGKK